MFINGGGGRDVEVLTVLYHVAVAVLIAVFGIVLAWLFYLFFILTAVAYLAMSLRSHVFSLLRTPFV
jgi:hypothetical protein